MINSEINSALNLFRTLLGEDQLNFIILHPVKFLRKLLQ